MNISANAGALGATQRLCPDGGSIRRADGKLFEHSTSDCHAFFSMRSVPPSTPAFQPVHWCSRKPRLFELSTRFLILNFVSFAAPRRTPTTLANLRLAIRPTADRNSLPGPVNRVLSEKSIYFLRSRMPQEPSPGSLVPSFPLPASVQADSCAVPSNLYSLTHQQHPTMELLS